MLSSFENSNCWKVLSHIKLQSDFIGCLPDPLPGADLGNTMGWVSALASGILATIRDFLSASLVWLLFLVPSRFPPAMIPDPFPRWFPAYICAPITKVSPEMKTRTPSSQSSLILHFPKRVPRNTSPVQCHPKGCTGHMNVGNTNFILRESQNKGVC